MAEFNGMRGPDKLRAYAKGIGVPLVSVAKILGVSDQCIHQWSAGLGRPRNVMQWALQTLAGIEPGDWLTTEEREELKEIQLRIEGLRSAKPVDPPTFHQQMAGRI